MLRVTFVVLLAACAAAQFHPQPEQVHLSYGGDPSQMLITWVTRNQTKSTLVEYGPGKLSFSVRGTETLFTDGGDLKRKMYIHRVHLTGLQPGQTYIYHCGGDLGWSNLFYFTAAKTDPNWQPVLAVFGDLGNSNAQSLPRLQQSAIRGEYDMVLHVGDFAYDMEVNNAEVGDAFMRQIEPIAAYIPYMSVVGNHENAYNFSNYVNRFTMPNGESSLFYSFDFGPAHFIALSTEFYFFTNFGTEQIANQFAWLSRDLEAANANRKNIPWIITMGHRPMYCSNWDGDDCTRYQSIIRTGTPGNHQYGLEDLFYKHGVDLEIWAHEHSYERLWPIYNRTIYNGTSSPYVNPPAPVHIITGSAGCKEDSNPFRPLPAPWSAFRSLDYGYTLMTLVNNTHLLFKQVSDDRKGAIIDQFWLQKDVHGPYDQINAHATAKQRTGHYVPVDLPMPENYVACPNCDVLKK